VELAVDRAAGAAVAALAHGGAGEQPLGVAEAGGQLEVVAGRAHGRRHEDAVEVDLERLLHREDLGPPVQLAPLPAVGEHLGGPTPWHVAEGTNGTPGGPRGAGRRRRPRPGRACGCRPAASPAGAPGTARRGAARTSRAGSRRTGPRACWRAAA